MKGRVRICDARWDGMRWAGWGQVRCWILKGSEEEGGGRVVVAFYWGMVQLQME